MTLADLQLAIGTGALPVHSRGFPDRSLALSWSECPQKFQHSVGVSLRSCRRSGPLFCAEIRISLRGGGDSGKSPALPGPTPSPGGPALRRAFYLVPSPAEGVCFCQLLASGIPLWGEPSLQRAAPERRLPSGLAEGTLLPEGCFWLSRNPPFTRP